MAKKKTEKKIITVYEHKDGTFGVSLNMDSKFSGGASIQLTKGEGKALLKQANLKNVVNGTGQCKFIYF